MNWSRGIVQFNWTDEKVEELKRRWAAGESCREIGAAMKVSRCAVIGKISRLGLSGRKVVMKPEQREASRQKRNASRIVRQRIERNSNRGEPMQPLPPKALPVFVGSLNIPFADLRDLRNGEPNQCRYIAAEPAAPDYLACGNETLPGESYCGHCKGIVYGRHHDLTDEARELLARNATRRFRGAEVKLLGVPREEAA